MSHHVTGTMQTFKELSTQTEAIVHKTFIDVCRRMKQLCTRLKQLCTKQLLICTVEWSNCVFTSSKAWSSWSCRKSKFFLHFWKYWC